jgi:hypothetical protein
VRKSKREIDTKSEGGSGREIGEGEDPNPKSIGHS